MCFWLMLLVGVAYDVPMYSCTYLLSCILNIDA